LLKQLRDLDPDGVIKKFIEEKGPRPDISYLINRKKRKGKKLGNDGKGEGGSVAMKSKPPPRKGAPPAAKSSSSSSSSSSKNISKGKDEEDEDEEGDEEEATKRAPKSAPPPPPPSRAAATMDDDQEGVEPHEVVLNELFDTLEGVISNKQRKTLVEYLHERITNIEDAKKRDSSVSAYTCVVCVCVRIQLLRHH